MATVIAIGAVLFVMALMYGIPRLVNALTSRGFDAHRRSVERRRQDEDERP